MTYRPPQYPQQPPYGPGGQPWPQAYPGGSPPKKSRKGLWIGLSIGLVVVLAIVIGVVVMAANGKSDAPVAANQQVPQGPPDRDAQAITAALRQLDPCKLLDLESARARGVSQAVTFATGPHACTMATDPGWTTSYTSKIWVMVGTENSFGNRYLEKPVTLGGAKAYELRQDSGSSNRSCVLDIPVSHTRAISLHLDSDLVTDPKYGSCGIVERYGTAAIAKLANPDALSMDTSQRPMAAWDGCAMLTKLLGADAGKYRMIPDGSSDLFSGCRAIDDKDRQTQGSPALQAKYDRWMPGRTDNLTQVGGKDAIVTQQGDSCFVQWNQGPTGVNNVWLSNLVMKIEGRQGCAATQRTAEQAMQLVGQAPNDVTAKPQRPLLYGPDDNDTGSVGACVDFANGESNSGCVPYTGGVKVPKTFEDAASASHINKAVQCEAFQDAVRAAFGDTLKPVTWGEHCFFVEPTHTLILTVDIDGADAPQPYGTGGVYRDRQVRQVGGKQSVTYWDKTKSAYDVYYSPYNDLGRNGNLHIEVEAKPPRGESGADAAITVPLDPAKAQLVEQVIAQVAQKYFA